MFTTRTILLIALCLIQVARGIAVPTGDELPQERYEERVSFRPVLLGDRGRERAEIDLRPGADNREPFVIVQHPDPPFTVDTLPGQRGDTIDVAGRRVVIGATFAPTRQGEWRDSIVLVRYTPFDRIVVRLYGVGVSATRETSVNFGDVLTGDTARRIVVVRREFAQDPRMRWRVESPKEPFFAVSIDRPVPIPGSPDTLGFVFGFTPTSDVRSEEKIRIIRLLEGGVLLDTLECELNGVGRRMPQDIVYTAADVEAGSTTSLSKQIDLPVTPRQAYAYELLPRSAGPVTGVVVNPVGFTTAPRISVQFICEPTGVGPYQRSFILRRSRADGVVDSTLITVNGRATQPPPPSVFVRAGFADAIRSAKIGDTVDLPIVLEVSGSEPIPTVFLTSMQCTLSYNPSVLVPLAVQGTTIVERFVRDDRQFVVLRLDRPDTADLVTGATAIVVRFVAVLGDDDRSSVEVAEAFIVDATDKTIELRDDDLTQAVTTVILSNAWQHAGGQRRVNTLQGPLDILVEPNPVEDVATLRVINVPTDVGRLSIVDAMGQVVADLTDALHAGVTAFSVGSSSGVDVRLAAGSYYARLTVRGVDDSTLHSVVRLIVMQ